MSTRSVLSPVRDFFGTTKGSKRTNESGVLSSEFPRTRAVAVAPAHRERTLIATGASNGRLHEVVDMVEKPELSQAPSDLAIFGRYVLAPDVFDALSETEPGKGEEIQLTDALKKTLERARVVAYEFEGDYYDTGTVPGYLRANLAMALKRPDLRDAMLGMVREMIDRSELTVQ